MDIPVAPHLVLAIATEQLLVVVVQVVQVVQVHATQHHYVLLEQPVVALNQTVAQVLQIQLLAYQLIMALEAVDLLLCIAVNVAAHHISALAQVLVVQVLVVMVVPVQT
jgi:hypothetical protein